MAKLNSERKHQFNQYLVDDKTRKQLYLSNFRLTESPSKNLALEIHQTKLKKIIKKPALAQRLLENERSEILKSYV